MESLHQIFTTVIAALIFLILVIKFASYATAKNNDHDQLKSNKAENSITKSKSKNKKKVRFAVDQIEPVDAKLVDENVGKCELDEKMCYEIDEIVKEKEGLISEEDDSSDEDWEGVERSDLEKLFAVAAEYGKVDEHLRNVESDVQMELYGLYKVATEGPCREGQPMALKVSARAKWNAWQKLGNMNPDVAMEQYINLLSEKVPGWSHSVDKN